MHPMAMEFNTRHPDTLFFPTLHIHDGAVHAEEDYDHTLYFQEPLLQALYLICHIVIPMA